MKKLQFLSVFLLLTIFSYSSCNLIPLDPSDLTDADIVAGLKEALSVGTENSVVDANAVNGYFANEAIKIFLPEEAAIVESTLRGIGFGSIVDDLILKLNRAAEDAAIEAQPIFLDAITNMTIDDGVNILHGSDDAATEYLKTNTYTDLHTLFKPKVEASLETVGANTAWAAVIDQYNTIPFVPTVNPDLADHTTTKALDGLFHLIEGEELKIREDVNARVTDLLQRVFGELDS